MPLWLLRLYASELPATHAEAALRALSVQRVAWAGGSESERQVRAWQRQAGQRSASAQAVTLERLEALGITIERVPARPRN